MTSLERLRSVELLMREQKIQAMAQLRTAIRIAADLHTPPQWSEYETKHRVQDMDHAMLEKHVEELLYDLRARSRRLDPVTTTLRLFDVHSHHMLQSEPAVRDKFICETWAQASDTSTFPRIGRVQFSALRKAHDASTPLICQRACRHIGFGQTAKHAAADAVRAHMTQCCGLKLRSIQPPLKRLRLRLQQQAERDEEDDDDNSDDDEDKGTRRTRKRKRSNVDCDAPLEQYEMLVGFTPAFVMEMLLPRFGAALRRAPLHASGFACVGAGSPATPVEREAKQLAPLCEHEFRDDTQCAQFRTLRAHADHATRCCKQPLAYMTMYRAMLTKHLSPMSVACCMRLAFNVK